MAYSSIVSLILFGMVAASAFAQAPGASPTHAPKSSPPSILSPPSISTPPTTAPTVTPVSAPTPITASPPAPGSSPASTPAPSIGNPPAESPEPPNAGTLNKVAVAGSVSGFALVAALLL